MSQSRCRARASGKGKNHGFCGSCPARHGPRCNWQHKRRPARHNCHSRLTQVCHALGSGAHTADKLSRQGCHATHRAPARAARNGVRAARNEVHSCATRAACPRHLARVSARAEPRTVGGCIVPRVNEDARAAQPRPRSKSLWRALQAVRGSRRFDSIPSLQRSLP